MRLGSTVGRCPLSPRSGTPSVMRHHPIAAGQGQPHPRVSSYCRTLSAKLGSRPNHRRRLHTSRDYYESGLSIRRKIMGIAVTLIVLMAITAVLTVVLVMQVGSRIEELTYSYIPAYGDLARANIRSLERALAIRRIVIEKLQSPADDGQLHGAAQPLRRAGRTGRTGNPGRARLDPWADREGSGVRRRIDAGPVRDPDRRHQ